jgi:hypothetical protein
MQLEVLFTNGDSEIFPYPNYATENGELDIQTEHDFTVTTLAKGTWQRVNRLRDGEEWPRGNDRVIVQPNTDFDYEGDDIQKNIMDTVGKRIPRRSHD